MSEASLTRSHPYQSSLNKRSLRVCLPVAGINQHSTWLQPNITELRDSHKSRIKQANQNFQHLLVKQTIKSASTCPS